MCCEPSISSAFPTPEIENLVAGPWVGGGSDPYHPQCLASLPFPDTEEAGFEVAHEGGERGTVIS